ncbi:MetQ/NlpA family ABC transporter substrate-binding protein [Tyzzerella sp. OttesenSCG-928-J15]|nr:MetQ/NlpA family ABC transporter substrate-binding protein [Tyzzerella sp. OttesenSCG-928-J15]
MKKIKLLKSLSLVLLFAILACACGEKESELRVYKLGVNGTEFQVWEDVSKRLEEKGIKLEIISFADYIKPNQALAEGEIDLNAFQTVNYFEKFRDNHGLDLEVIQYTIVAPMGVYSEKITDISELGDSFTVAIPNDESNGGRAIRFLENLGFLKVKEGAGLAPTMMDITEYIKDVEIVEMAATQIPRSLADVDFAIINNGVAYEAGLTIADDAIIYEDPNEPIMKNYWNVVACRTEDADKEDFKTIVEVYNTQATKDKINEVYGGQQVPVF